MTEITVNIKISAAEYLAHYKGTVTDVMARAEDGRIIRFPSNILKPFVTHDGICGSFVISFDINNHFIGINAIA